MGLRRGWGALVFGVAGLMGAWVAADGQVAAVAVAADAGAAGHLFARAGEGKVGAAVLAPELIYSVDPEFRARDLERHFDGVCALAFTVDAEGRPRDVHVVQSMGAGRPGLPGKTAAELDRSAVEAVQQYRFAPARQEGKAVAVEVRVEVDLHVI